MQQATKGLLAAVLVAAVSGCGSSSGGGVASVGSVSAGTTQIPLPQADAVTASCSAKLPRKATDYTITVNIPSDTDKASQNITPTSKIAYTVMLPERCPGETFPIILQSHGYAGTRLKTIAADNSLKPKDAHFPSIDSLVQALPYYGYVVISYDERGHGDSKPASGGAYARIIDPEAEVRDGIAILDWAWQNATTGGNGPEQLPVQAEDKVTGIPKDLKVGTIGYSYGGGFEMPLAALDPRIDTMVPNGTWHNLVYSLLPGDGTKNGFDGLLCLLANNSSTQNTPLVATLCEILGPTNPKGNTIRTRADLAAASSSFNSATATGRYGPVTRAVTEKELIDFFNGHGAGYFKQLEQAGKPYPGQSQPYKQRALPVFFLQGNRDSLFNMTEGYWNWKYYTDAAAGSAAAPVRFYTTDGGHMNPLANQKESPADCGGLQGVVLIKAWFDHWLKGVASATYDSIPPVCISVSDTPASNAVPATPVGVKMQTIPVGSLSGTGALAATLASGSASVNPSNVDPNPAFVSLVTVPDAGYVVAGIPTIDSITVAAGTGGSATTPVAYVGVGIVRGSSTILVDQVLTPFVEGTHTNNRNINESDNTKVLLAGVGEQLQKGDQLGLVFYCTQVQYESVASSSNAAGAGGLGGSVTGQSPPSTGQATPNTGACTNNYSVTFKNAALPVFKPGLLPGSLLNKP